jgi:hypothetical protein
MSKDTIDGYLGIMELDLTNIPENLKKVATEQHMKDIENYKGEQALLPVKLRYENTIMRIQKLHEFDQYKQKQHLEKQQEEQLKRNETYNNRFIKK